MLTGFAFRIRLRIVCLPRSVEFFDIQTVSQICYYNGYSAGSVQKVIERVSTPSTRVRYLHEPVDRTVRMLHSTSSGTHARRNPIAPVPGE